LNGIITDLPNAYITRWISYIRIYDFILRYVPGRIYSAADGLSRRGPQPDDDDIDITADIDDIINANISSITTAEPARLEEASLEDLRVTSVWGTSEPPAHTPFGTSYRILISEYSEDSEIIAQFLTTFRRPQSIAAAAFRHFKSRALKFVVSGGYLFRRARKHIPLRRVIDSSSIKTDIMSRIHNEIAAYRGREATYALINERYWWHGMYIDIRIFVNTYVEC
jgi:hypothetical protein